MVSTETLGPGSCLTDAFSEGGIGYERIAINPWPSLSEIKGICDTLELKFHSRETDTLPPNNVPVIAIYHTEGIKSHAVYTESLESLRTQDLSRVFLAYIEL